LKNNIKLRNFDIFGLVIFGIVIAMILFPRPLPIPAFESKSSPLSSHGSGSSAIGGKSTGNNVDSTNSNNKVVMINFDDSYKTQIVYAKPILDQYGFKATFFEVCGWVGKNSERQSWQDVAALRQDGMEIESHTMTPAHLNSVSTNKLYYELGFAKQCFATHGYQVPIFGYPDNLGSDNKTVINVVAKYYSLARTGSDPLMFLHCNGFTKHLLGYDTTNNLFYLRNILSPTSTPTTTATAIANAATIAKPSSS